MNSSSRLVGDASLKAGSSLRAPRSAPACWTCTFSTFPTAATALASALVFLLVTMAAMAAAGTLIDAEAAGGRRMALDAASFSLSLGAATGAAGGGGGAAAAASSCWYQRMRKKRMNVRLNNDMRFDSIRFEKRGTKGRY